MLTPCRKRTAELLCMHSSFWVVLHSKGGTQSSRRGDATPMMGWMRPSLAML